jgi:hypothetical protein
MVYTCGKCKRQMHDDEPHFRMYHHEHDNDNGYDSVTTIECPSCGALFVDEHTEGSPHGTTRVLVNWNSRNPLRSLAERARNFLADFKGLAARTGKTHGFL